MAATLDLCDFMEAETLATNIANKYQTLENMRSKWLQDKKEIQQYVFATDTSTTTNASLPWKNKVHIPKLCQIRDNLHANYMAALRPNDNAIIWEGDDTDSETHEKRITIQNYMSNKLKQGNFWTEVSKLVLDYIDYGNVFAMPVFVAEYTTDPITGDMIPAYIGPRLQRISPYDIVFDPTAPSFQESPKIIRSLVSIGTLRAEIESKPELGYREEIFDKMMENRRAFAAHSQGDFVKNSTYQFNGFSGFWEYFNSDYVEILDFYGDIYDKDNDVLYKNHLISVVDRSYIIRKEQSDNWLGVPPIRHAGWRIRQDNLYAMGPLDNLVGLQHRIDHLENAKADGFDLIVQPVLKVTGFVEDFDYGPGERIHAGEEGDVEFMSPDVTFLQADTQIAMYEDKMEEMAGAPKQAMGFRTPGEKTAYEVQTLENSANRIFNNKTSYFEEIFLEPLINDMLEMTRRNLNEADSIRVLDDETQAVTFQKITKEDITARGKLRPIGARHFAQNANTLQNFTQFAASALGQNPVITSHFSGKRLAQAIETLLGVEKYKVFQPNIGLYEAAEMRQIQSSLDQSHMEEQTAGMNPEDAAMATQNMMAQQQEGQPK
jgi:hypothetical protein